MSNLPHVLLYTDGACSPNPGLGGWGAVLLYPKKDYRKEISGGERDTTNNRMEMQAAIQGLAALKTRCHVDLYTDSKYVRNAFEKDWIGRWKKNGWRTADKKPVKNEELWRRLIDLVERHDVTWHWVKGHAGDPENERADELAVNARLAL